MLAHDIDRIRRCLTEEIGEIADVCLCPRGGLSRIGWDRPV